MILSQTELQLAEEIDFRVRTLELLKNETKNSITKSPLFDENNDFLGFSKKAVVSNATNGKKSLKTLRKWFSETEYFLFLSDFKLNQLTILKAKNQFEILEFQKTESANFEISTADIIEKFKTWDYFYGVNIIGAGSYWILFEKNKRIRNIDSFAEELFEFCPDIINQGFGDMQSLVNYLRKNNDIFLWWD
jgi:Domain of unknown function (DUF4253)